MATINAVKGVAAVPYKGISKSFVLEGEVDFQALNVASGDVVEVIPVKAGMRILLVETEIVTPADSATSATYDVGDGADADGYDAAVNLKATAGTIACTAIGTDAYGASGKRYTADDTIDVSPTYTGATTQKGKIRIKAIGVWLG